MEEKKKSSSMSLFMKCVPLTGNWKSISDHICPLFLKIFFKWLNFCQIVSLQGVMIESALVIEAMLVELAGITSEVKMKSAL